MDKLCFISLPRDSGHNKWTITNLHCHKKAYSHFYFPLQCSPFWPFREWFYTMMTFDLYITALILLLLLLGYYLLRILKNIAKSGYAPSASGIFYMIFYCNRCVCNSKYSILYTFYISILWFKTLNSELKNNDLFCIYTLWSNIL